MKHVLKLSSYLFHPIFLPLAGCLLYFAFSPRFFPKPIVHAKLLAIAIVTVFIPIVFFFLLKTLGLIKSVFLRSVKERSLPLMLYVVLIYFMVLRLIFDIINFQELYFYFTGILFSTLTCLILVFFRFKVSLHMVGIAGLTTFVMALSLHYKINLLNTIAFLVAITGLVASARLYADAHDKTELVFGLAIGFLPQFIILQYWL